MRQYYSPDGADGYCITSNKSLTCLVCNLFSRRIGAIFGMLSRRTGLSASAGLSCYDSQRCATVSVHSIVICGFRGLLVGVQ